MRVIIASTIIPFVEGGGTFIVDWLEQKLKEYGHAVEVLKLPFHSFYPEMLDQMLALRLLDVSAHADRLIAIRTPSYLLKHHTKVLWFIHHHRGAYDLWGTPYQDIPSTPEGRGYRNAILSADNIAFRESKKIFTNSHTVSQRLKTFNRVDSEVLYPPLLHPSHYRCDGYGEYILYVSRITHHKRQHLAVESMRFTKTPVKLVLAGQPDNDTELERLTSAVTKYKLGEKIEILSEWISEAKKADLFANCLAAIYMPLDEDSYGYPSLEAYHSNKAVITTCDAGGTLELIVDRENGFVTKPEPKAIAAVMDELYLNRETARTLGRAGRFRLNSLNINWDNVVTKLLS